MKWQVNQLFRFLLSHQVPICTYHAQAQMKVALFSISVRTDLLDFPFRDCRCRLLEFCTYQVRMQTELLLHIDYLLWS